MFPHYAYMVLSLLSTIETETIPCGAAKFLLQRLGKF